ncbi:MAG: translocation/assembly module TamB, partial [Bryobacteraceae bacterium]|nr:translocation/assembly module TamB [Bryobacteraceae bacterium]
AYRLNDILLRDIRIETDISASGERIDLGRLRVAAMGGAFEGGATVEAANRFSVSGNLKNLSLARLAEWNKQKAIPWSSVLSGSVAISGRAHGKQLRDGVASAQLRLQPDAGGIPLAGELNVGWEQRSKQVWIDSSFLQTPATRVNFAGVLGEKLDVGVLSSDLDDFLPVMRLLSGTTPSIPVTLHRGEARFNGSVLGPLEQPRVAGKITARNVAYQGRNFDTLEVDLEAAEQKFTLSQVLLTHGPLHLEGRASLGLDKWKLGGASPITGRASIRGAELAELLAIAGSSLPVKGLLSATVNLAGTLSGLNAGARLRIDKLSAWNEQFDRLEATVDLQEDVVNLTSGRLHRNGTLIEAKGAYKRGVRDWSSGSVRLNLSTAGMTLAALDGLQRLKAGLSGQVDVKTALAGRIANKQFHLDNIDGRLVVRNVTLEKHPLGSMAVSAATRNRQVMLTWQGSLRKSQIRGEGQIDLRDGYPWRGKLSFSRLVFAELEPLLQRKSANQELPFDGFIDGEATFEGNMTQPESVRAEVRVDSFELRPKAEGQAAADLVLRNASPLLFAVDSKRVNIKSAEFVARDTDLVASGSLSFRSRSPWDLKLKGKVNLGILKSFNSDLIADGSSTLDAAVWGSLDAPRLSGRMELSNASFYLQDVPNGIEKANGVVLFNQDRASIEKLTAQTGGGRLDLSGFVGFGGNEYVYMLRAALDKVRVRYPEGVSTTIDAALSLTGTSSRSLLGGTVTVIRSGFNPRIDLGGLLAQTSRRAPPPASNNPFLRGMQFDVRIETAPNLQFQTSLTRDLQMEADLRLRGSPLKPVVLGNIAVNRGEIQFFGNRYTITRGDISFFNSAKIEPVLDIDLETRVRAVTVNINFSGPIDKLNVTYRSDPPLQSSEITALLTVGRTPTATDPNLSTAQQNSNQSLFQSGANSLLGQAVAAPISGRLERFFGVSRLKIDPQLNGIDNIPQARLTLEQQISKDITLTYVTNLTRSQQQLVRLEWNMSQFWSVIAVRDENGLFGIDFQFRKRFK